VVVDERTRTLTVRFDDTATPAELFLVPGDPDEAVRVAPVVNTPTGRLCEFAGLPDGEYLLVVPSAAE
jgi:hypothetical protein